MFSKHGPTAKIGRSTAGPLEVDICEDLAANDQGLPISLSAEDKEKLRAIAKELRKRAEEENEGSLKTEVVAEHLGFKFYLHGTVCSCLRPDGRTWYSAATQGDVLIPDNPDIDVNSWLNGVAKSCYKFLNHPEQWGPINSSTFDGETFFDKPKKSD